jgi:hypothetical protein
MKTFQRIGSLHTSGNALHVIRVFLKGRRAPKMKPKGFPVPQVPQVPRWWKSDKSKQGSLRRPACLSSTAEAHSR